MKTMIRNLQTVIALAAIFAMPYLASAAKSFASMTTIPASTNITPGVAATVSTTVTATDGTGGSAVTTGSHCQFTILSINPSDPSVTASLSLTNYNAATGTAQPTTLTVTTTSLTPSNTYVVSVMVSSNPPNTLLINQITNTFTISMTPPPAFVPLRVWSPAGANTNWSTAGNWTPSGSPVSSNDLQFVDLGAVGSAGLVDNVVDNNFTIGSLTYGQTNNFHTTLIASGKTLTLVGTNGLTAGTGTDVGTLVTVNTITGAGGTLIVSNTAANVNIGQANPSASNGGNSAANATLDMSGLGVFNATISRMLVGVDSLLKGDNGVLNLAMTNIITMTPGSAAPQISIGEDSQSSPVSATASNSLLLGQTNAFSVDSIAVGRGRTDHAIMSFNSTLTSPTAYFRGTNGNASRVGTWTIGDGYNGKLNSCHATNDFSLGTVNALVNTMNIGVGANVGTTVKPTPGAGVLFVNAGIIDVNNLNVGVTYSTNGAPYDGNGSGTVNLTGGSLVVNSNLALAATALAGIGSGTLNISSATVKANSGITVGAGMSTISLTSGTLSATNSTATIGTSNNPVSNFSITGSTLNLALQNNSPSIATTNLVIGGGPNPINISSVPLLTGFPAQFQVIQYGINGGISTGDLTTFALGSLPSASPNYGAYISNNVANNSIDIVFTNGPFVPALVWDGTNNGNWNTSTTNWKPNSGPDTVYIDTAFVTFDDTLRGTTSVSLTGTLLPGSLTVNNTSSNYVFGGTGKISGSVGLLKTGSGSLTLDNSGVNDFSGGVTISGGTLQIGNNDANGNLPAGSVIDNGALIFRRTDANVTVPNVLSGTGTLTQNGASANILTLTGTNTSYVGAITVLQGTLQPGNPKAFGTNQTTGSITVTNAATLDVNNQKFGAGAALPVTVSGPGVGNNGAIVNNSSNQTSVLHIVTMTADTTLGGSGNWDIRTSGGTTTTSDAQLNGAFNLTKVNTNTITLTSVTVDPALENINVQAGTLDMANLSTSLGDANATATVYTNAMLVLDTLANVLSKVVVLNSGATLKGASTNSLGGPVTFDGPVTLAGPTTITANSGALFLLRNTVSGPGGFTKPGNGTLFLAASNTYAGSTVVSGGTLALTNYNAIDGSIDSTTNINITSGAVIDVSGRSDNTLTLKNGQTLVGGVTSTNGPGTVNGNLIVGAGATIAPGNAGTTNAAAGTLSITANLTLQGNTVLKVSGTNGNDQMVAAAINNGGTLMVASFASAVTNGQSFQLLVASNGVYNTGTFSSVTLPSATGLTWTNTLSTNGRITAGVMVGPPPIPAITHIGLTGTTLRINGTNGVTGDTLYVLTSTNLALPLSQWKTNMTGTFSPGGSFNLTNTVDTSAPQSYYLIKYNP